VSPLPNVKAWTWIVADADTGNVLGGREWHHPLPPASTLKTLTAYTLAPRLILDSVYTATKADAAAEGSHVGLAAKSTYTVEDLMHGMLMPSGNDAAHALANAYGGLDRTTQAMNAEAARLGAKDTKAINDSGLDEPGQTSSAYDLALIMRASLHDPVLRQMYSLHHVDFPVPAQVGRARTTTRIWTENRLILNRYPGAISGKTGFTSQAGRTFVAAVQRNGRTLIVAIMRCAERTERTAHRILDWGFANIDKVSPVDKLVDPGPVSDVITPIAAQSAPIPTANMASSGVSTSSGPGSSPMLILLFILSGVVAVVAGLRWRARRLIAASEVSRLERERRRLAAKQKSMALRSKDDARV